MGFIMDGLESEAYDRKYSDRALFGRIASYFKPFRFRLALVALVLAAAALSEFAAQVVISRALDAATVATTTGTIVLLALAVAGFGVMEWLFNFARHYLSGKVVGDTIWRLRSDAFAKAMAHDLSFYDENAAGKVVSRITTDTEDFAGVIALVADLASQIMLVVFFFAYLMSISTLLSLLLLAMAPFAILVAIGFRKLARFVTLNAKRVTAEVNARIQESIAGVSVAKAFRRERSLWTGFKTDNALAYRFHLRRGVVMQLIFPVVAIASGVGNGVIAYAGGGSVRGGVVSLGQWFLFMQAVGYFWWPMLNIASFWSQLQDGLAAAERVFSLIDRETKVKQLEAPEAGREEVGAAVAEAAIAGLASPGSVAAGSAVLDRVDSGFGAIRGKPLVFNGVHFAYSTKEKVLDGFSLTIGAGEKLAIVGKTGAGKSSIVKLLCRFYEFQQGSILVDGQDIRTMDLLELRASIGLVSQDPFLFPGTVMENIRYARPAASDAEVEAAARSLGRGDWVDDLPAGLQTATGHRGSSISMGQRQLVALSRVLLKDPALFILDEATSSVDPFTEAQIQEGLETVMVGRTAIVIAHRLSTVRFADRIIVLDQGCILEEGSHGALLAEGGHYAQLYDVYFRHQSVEYMETSARND
jgi:ABC-type multidrug transport system fused ATPase/permease subunit